MLTYKCHTCGKDNEIVNQCGCDLQNLPTKVEPIRRLTCCCCGESTMGRQWWNRDTGYGLCVKCIPLVSRPINLEGTTMERLYGVRGFHYDVEGQG